MTCPVCKVPSVGVMPCPGYCEGVEDGREHEWCPLEYCGIPRCIRCGVPNKLSVLRNFPYCPKMGAAERALLERDIAEVERAARDFRAREAVWLSYVALLVDSPCQARAYQREADGNAARALDCEAWLARARAVLGGGA